MSVARIRCTLSRQWELLKQLPPRGRGKSARELTEILNDLGFAISKRQVERDLAALCEVFPLFCDDSLSPYRWAWMDGMSLDIPGVSLAEAVSLRLIEETLGQLLPGSVLKAVRPRFELAREKLEKSLDSSMSRWMTKVRYIPPALPLCPPRVEDGVLEQVQQALLEDRQLKVEYLALKQGELREMILHPLGFVQRGPVSYLVARAFDYEDVRLYALHRMQYAEMLTLSVSRSDDFLLDAYVEQGGMEFGNGGGLTLRLRLAGNLERILLETPLSDDQRITRDGEHAILEATLVDSWQLRWWILSQGDRVEVLEPDGLRTEIMQSIRAMGERYGMQFLQGDLDQPPSQGGPQHDPGCCLPPPGSPG